jgi:hypothetical protein
VPSIGPQLPNATTAVIDEHIDVLPYLNIPVENDVISMEISTAGPKNASRPLVDFGVLNDNLIKGLILCVKCISRFLMKVQMYSLIHLLKYNYEASGTI